MHVSPFEDPAHGPVGVGGGGGGVGGGVGGGPCMRLRMRGAAQATQAAGKCAWGR
jgi:hypothetical protein